MPRAIWKGAISFGLVNIPIELYSATHDHRPKFRLLHAKDGEPVRYERVCRKDGTAVAWADLVKGYEYAKNRFVVLTRDDFKTAALEKTRTIDIRDFVDPAAIDERYFETPYYLLPGRGAEHAYAVLRDALRTAGRLGIATIILREAQHLAAVEPIGQALVLTMMRFSDELADLERFHFPAKADVRPAELAMAGQLIASLEAPWDPARYTDEYTNNLMRVIRAKVKGTRPRLVADDHAPKRAEVVDLMSRLRASLEARRATAGSSAKRSTSKRSKARRPAAAGSR